jgi:hypothetical protein
MPCCHFRCRCFRQECQIHGPVRLAQDITALSVHPRHTHEAETMKLVEAFRLKNKVEVIMLEQAQRRA